MNGVSAARHRWLKAFAVSLIALPAQPQAAELGRLTVLSNIGEPLNAQIEVLSIAPGEERALSSRVAAPRAFQISGIPYSPVLEDLRVTLERPRGRTFLRLRTTRPVSEPVVQLVLELNTGRDQQFSQYTVLLDPKRAPAAAAPAAKAPPKAPAPAKPPADRAAPSAPPSSREALFGLAAAPAQAAEAPKLTEAPAVQWRGFVQNLTAYDYEDPQHWSRAVIRTQLGAQGGSGNFKWKATARLDMDPVYASDNFYPDEVRDDQKVDAFLRETYFDTSAGKFAFRVGKQNIIWGEMVGLFFADVVSARDQRDFILPEFEIIRIPQWAIRAERFGENNHMELIWLPVPDVDIIGKPGAEFYPFRLPPPAGFSQRFNEQKRPTRDLSHSNFGLRASTLRAGWDLAAFYYRSTDVNPTFYREIVAGPTPTIVYTPRHDRIWQVGGTLGKDLGATVLKAEAFYTDGRNYFVTRLAEPDGVVPQQTLDYVIGLDFTLPRDTRLNLQYFERVFHDHDPDLLFDQRESGVSLLLSGKLGAGLRPELLVISSLNRSDRLVRTKLGWTPARNLQLTFGVDVFTGPVTGLFGRFADRDRVYVETRYDF